MLSRAVFKSEHKLVPVFVFPLFLECRYRISPSNAVQGLHHDQLRDEDHNLLEGRN